MTLRRWNSVDTCVVYVDMKMVSDLYVLQKCITLESLRLRTTLHVRALFRAYCHIRPIFMLWLAVRSVKNQTPLELALVEVELQFPKNLDPQTGDALLYTLDKKQSCEMLIYFCSSIKMKYLLASASRNAGS